MPQTLAIVIPVFAVILLGYGVGKTRLFSEEGVRALSSFCFNVAIPATLFRAMATLDTPEGFDFGVVAAFYSAVLLTYGLAMLTAQTLFRLPLADQAMFAASATYSNILLLGLPLVLTAFGPRAALPQSAILAFQSVILISLTSIIIEVARGRERYRRGPAGRNGGTRGAAEEDTGGSIRAILRAAAIAVVTNPVVVSLVAGFLWGRTGLGLHEILDKILHFLGQAATPTALFALGASLTRFKAAGDPRQTAALGVLKLLVLPVLCYVSAHYVFALSPLSVAVATLSGAMPAGVTAFMLAMRYELLVARVAAAVIVTTAIAWISVAVLLAWLLPGLN